MMSEFEVTGVEVGLHAAGPNRRDVVRAESERARRFRHVGDVSEFRAHHAELPLRYGGVGMTLLRMDRKLSIRLPDA